MPCLLVIRCNALLLLGAVIDRQLAATEHAQQMQQVRCMWQLAAVLEFLHVFSAHLQLRDNFTPEELEYAIVAETGQTGILANLHQVCT